LGVGGKAILFRAMYLGSDSVGTQAGGEALHSNEQRLLSSMEEGNGHSPKGLTSSISAAFMLCAMALGVGVFTMPTVFNQVGVLLGSFLIVFFGVLSTTMMLMTLDVAERRNCGSWEEVVNFAPGGRFMSSISLFLAPLIANAAHIQVVGGMFFDLMAYFIIGDKWSDATSFNFEHKVVLYMIFIGVVLPHCFVDDLTALRHIGCSVAGVVLGTCILAIVCSLGLLATKGAPPESQRSPLAPPGGLVELLKAAPTICFAYSSMFCFWETFAALKRGMGSQAQAAMKMKNAVIMSSAFVTCAYLLVALCCIWAFGTTAGTMTGGNGNGNVLYNFAPDNYPMTFMCLFLVVVIMLDYPIIFYPLVNMLLRAYNPGKYGRHAYHLVLAALVITIDVAVPDLGDVFDA
jgi:amino acid permease